MENDASSEGEAKREFRCDPEQYAMLKRCSDKRDMTEWNQWRKANPTVGVWLQGADLRDTFLEGVNLTSTHLEGADLADARLEEANLSASHLDRCCLGFARLQGAKLISATLQRALLQNAHVERAELWGSHLEGAHLYATHLEGADLRGSCLRRCCFQFAHLRGANLGWADLGSADLHGADLAKANLECAWLENAIVLDANLRSACFEGARVDGNTLIWDCQFDRGCDFRGVALDGARIEPGMKESLKYNVRRLRWVEWFKTGGLICRLCKKVFLQPFWWISDYGRSTGRIILVFFALAALFALTYWHFPETVMVRGEVGAIRGPLHALYFSVVTMTTLGFGDIHANPDWWVGQVLLMVQVVLGYVLLGALVTRFAVLFSGEGPAREFAKKEKRKRAPKAQQKEDGAEEDAENSSP